MRNYGSVWHRWDLHIHTPGTGKNDQYAGASLNEKWDRFYQEISNYIGDATDPLKDICAIGITDYLSIENYQKVKRDSNLPLAIQAIFPNVEARLSLTAKDSPVNIHFIFDPNIADELDARFFSKLKFTYGNSSFSATKSELIRLGKQLDRSMSNQEAYKHGVDQFLIDLQDLRKLFDEDKELRRHTIIGVVNSDTDGASGIGKKGAGSQTLFLKDSIYQFADVIFSAKPSDCQYFLGQKECDPPETIIERYGSLMPCIHGSDAHSLDKIFEPDQQRYCWIKAEPTFEGLLQVLYEPIDRVKIQPNCPDEKDPHQIIQSIKFSHSDFQPDPIVFNDNLTCIIGGKSTGKSLLLHQIAKSINQKYTQEQEGEFVRKDTERINASVTWKDGTTNSRRFIYIPQSYLIRAIDNPQKSSGIQEILERVLLQEPEISAAYTKMNDSLTEIAATITSSISAYNSKASDLKEMIAKISEFGSSEIYKKTLTELQSQRDKLAREINVTQEDIEKYTELQVKQNELQNEFHALGNEFQLVQKMTPPKLILPGYFSLGDDNQLSDTLSDSFPSIGKEIQDGLAKLGESVLIQWNGFHKNLLVQMSNSLVSLESRLNEIKDLVNTLKAKIEQNKQLQKLSEKINSERDKLTQSRKLEESKMDLQTQLKNIKEQLISSQSKYSEICEKYCETIKVSTQQSKTQLSFGAQVVWKKDEFQALLGNVFDNRNFPTFRNATNYDLTDLDNDSYSDKLLRVIWDAMECTGDTGSLSFKSSHNIMNVLPALFSNWYNIHYTVMSDDDFIERMSPGKKALVLLELLISLENSKCPILIDQPEDDLDNRSIYSKLANFIREKKKERQIIIVTHNANIVLGADAEEIIVANQDGADSKNCSYKFEYRSGAIESNTVGTDDFGNSISGVLNETGIQTQICDILEGGKLAFELRRSKYMTV